MRGQAGDLVGRLLDAVLAEAVEAGRGRTDQSSEGDRLADGDEGDVAGIAADPRARVGDAPQDTLAGDREPGLVAPGVRLRLDAL